MKAVLIFLLLLLCISACAPTTKSPPVSNEEALEEVRIQKRMAAEEKTEQLKRLYRIGMPITAANAPLCGQKIWPYHGMMLESLSGVAEEFKDAMQIYYGLQNQLTVAYIAPGSPVEGKIVPGDQIVAVNGVSIPSGEKGKKKFYDVIWKDGRDVTLPITITVERGRKGAKQDITFNPPAACASFIAMEDDDDVNAYADSANIVFTTGMLRYAADDGEVAAIFSHELAHNVRLHAQIREINIFLSQIVGVIIESALGLDLYDRLGGLAGSAFSQAKETEADYVGVYMLARAGYDLDKAMQFHRRFGATYPQSIHLAGTTHPSSVKRFLSIKKTVAEIKDKQTRGLPLVPEEKTGDDILRDLDKMN